MFLLINLVACGGGETPLDSSPATETGAEDSAADTSTPDTADTEETADTDTSGCPAVSASTRTALVTDIDETLTTDDLEFVYQIADPTHDPEMRPDANTLMDAYYALGYRTFYLTARGEDLSLLDGTSATDATTAWLDVHGFPRFDEDDVFLAPGIGALGEDAATYKAEVLAELQADGFTIVYAYGNADTDVEAYQAVGVDDSHDLLVGDLAADAGDWGVVGVPTEDAYTQHMAEWMGGVPCGG